MECCSVIVVRIEITLIVSSTYRLSAVSRADSRPTLSLLRYKIMTDKNKFFSYFSPHKSNCHISDRYSINLKKSVFFCECPWINNPN